MKNKFSRFYKILANDSLYGNSIYLMSSTGIMSVLGFFFWLLNARLYSTDQVGIATTLISMMTLISTFSILGLTNGLIRFLPTSNRKNEKINTSFTAVTLMAVLISVVYIVFLKTFSPGLLFIRENIFFSILFIIYVVFTSLFILSESVFIAYRSSKYILIKNTISSIIKLILPVFLVALGAYGIFNSVGIATAAAFIVSLIILRFRFSFRLKPVISTGVVKRMAKFSLGNYVAGFIKELPAMVLPIIIMNMIGARFSAFFYINLMIANLLYIIPIATSQVLLAEGSHENAELKKLIKKAAIIISIIIMPSIIILSVLGNYILLIFGVEYSREGFILLRFLSISGIFMSINSVGTAVLNIKQKIRLLIVTSCINTIVTLFLSVVLMRLDQFGIVGVGIGWIVGQGVTSIIYLFLIKRLLVSD